MQKVPNKYSKKWFPILATILIINFISLFSASKILGSDISSANIISFAILSLSISILITVGGFLGAKIHFITASIFNLASIVYMLYITISKSAEGWSDLVGIISYLTIIIIGLIAGLIIQLIYTIVTKKKGLSQ
ncbi:MAG: hypothetical protein PHQ32_00185 [Firmicutes bacterium]|nr:hypothetical protein [Bacillota bacterium]